MPFKTSITFIKISVVVLSVMGLILTVKLYDSENEIIRLTRNSDIDKKIHNNEINEILVRYDSVLIKNQRLSEEIILIAANLKQGKGSNLSVEMLQGDISILKKGNLTRQNQLATLNSILKSKQIELENNKEEIESLHSKISRLQSEINSSSVKVEPRKLRAINVNAIGAKIVSENIYESKKLKNTSQIKVCFTLEENPFIEIGAKEVFIQIINPKSNIVSKNPSILEIKNKTLYYSAKTTVNYGREDIDVCVFVDANKNNLLKGNYIINIFSGANLIGNANLTLV